MKCVLLVPCFFDEVVVSNNRTRGTYYDERVCSSVGDNLRCGDV